MSLNTCLNHYQQSGVQAAFVKKVVTMREGIGNPFPEHTTNAY